MATTSSYMQMQLHGHQGGRPCSRVEGMPFLRVTYLHRPALCIAGCVADLQLLLHLYTCGRVDPPWAAASISIDCTRCPITSTGRCNSVGPSPAASKACSSVSCHRNGLALLCQCSLALREPVAMLCQQLPLHHRHIPPLKWGCASACPFTAMLP